MEQLSSRLLLIVDRRKLDDVPKPGKLASDSDFQCDFNAITALRPPGRTADRIGSRRIGAPKGSALVQEKISDTSLTMSMQSTTHR